MMTECVIFLCVQSLRNKQRCRSDDTTMANTSCSYCSYLNIVRISDILNIVKFKTHTTGTIHLYRSI